MPHLFESKDSFKESFKEAVSDAYGRDFEDTYPEERYNVLGNMIRDFAGEHWRETKNAIKKTESKQLYYFSMEFLMGRLMTSNLMNLNIYDIVKDGLKEKKCELCGVSTWFDIELPLELHHKNNNHLDNNYDNLQILCPNCHSIQEGNAGANIGKYTKNG